MMALREVERMKKNERKEHVMARPSQEGNERGRTSLEPRHEGWGEGLSLTSANRVAI